MSEPPDRRDERPAYWIPGPTTRRHRYFYPSDDRAGIALMLLIAMLGLCALGFGIRHLVMSPTRQGRDLVLTGIGLLMSLVGLYQAYQLRRRD